MKNNPFSVVQPIEYAVKTFLGNWKWLLCIYILSLIPTYVGYALRYWAFYSNGQPSINTMNTLMTGGFFPVFMIINIVNLLLVIFMLTVWFPASYTRLSLALYDGKPFDLMSILSVVSAFPAMMGIVGLICLLSAVVVVSLIMLAHYALYLAVALGAALFLAALWLSVRISFSTFFIIDKRYGAKDALMSSYELMRGRCWLVWGVRALIGGSVMFACMLLALCGSIIYAGVGSVWGELPLWVTQCLMMFGNGLSMFLCSSLVWQADAYMYRKLHEYKEQPLLDEHADEYRPFVG